jgi:F0F1-type ATP synthase assembly protein I
MPFNRPIPESKPRAKPGGALASLIEAEKMMQIAFLLPAAAFVGWLAGAGLDKLLHQSWIAIFGILFGGVAGLVYVVRMAMAAGLKAAGGAGNGKSAESGKRSSEDEP